MEKPEVILTVDNVSKRFCRDLKRSLYYGVQDIASEVLGRHPRAEPLKKSEFWALRNVSFELERGRAVGLLGKNGSGKTTLLRIISGLIKPTVGSVSAKGRIAPLLALGAGFNPVLTGRENVYVNMSVLGLTRREIDERYDEVVDFAEIAYAMDAPLQSYSSGMQARLGFACAIHTNPDMLLLDEVTVVGDMQFQRKCEKKLREVRDLGTTFIVVSHSSGIVYALCETAVYLQGGQVKSHGSAKEVVEHYEEDLYNTAGAEILEGDHAKPVSSDYLEIRSVEIINHDDRSDAPLQTSKRAVVRFNFHLGKLMTNLHFLVKVYRLPSEDFFVGSEVMILHLGSLEDGFAYVCPEGDEMMELRFDSLMLVQGAYQIAVECYGADDSMLASRRSERFVVMTKVQFRHSGFYQPRKWVSRMRLDEEKLGFYRKTNAPDVLESPSAAELMRSDSVTRRLASLRPVQRTSDGWIEWGSLVDLFTVQPATLRWRCLVAKPFKSFALRPLNGDAEIVFGYYFSEGSIACYQVFVPSALVEDTLWELVCPPDMTPEASESDSRRLAFRDLETEVVPGEQVIHPYAHLAYGALASVDESEPTESGSAAAAH